MSISSDVILCLTTNTSCCKNNPRNTWFSPSGSSDQVHTHCFSTNSNVSAPSLYFLSPTHMLTIYQLEISRRPSAVSGLSIMPQTGIFTCNILDDNGEIATLYAGVGLTGTMIIRSYSQLKLYCNKLIRSFGYYWLVTQWIESCLHIFWLACWQCDLAQEWRRNWLNGSQLNTTIPTVNRGPYSVHLSSSSYFRWRVFLCGHLYMSA